MNNKESEWALILGGSSGFGLATAKRLSKDGLNICIVHRDRRGAMDRIEKEFLEIKNTGVNFKAFNLDALSNDGRAKVLNELEEETSHGKIRVLLHSIAFGSVRLIAPLNEDDTSVGEAKIQYGDNLLGDEDLALTIFAMGTSLLTWTQAIFDRKMFSPDARVLGLTSEGNHIAWRGYAAVSAAKAALEAISRSIAREFAPFGIRSNIVQPGVTDTPALRLIPGHERLASVAQAKNPFKRLTCPEDVANVIALLVSKDAGWINGSIIRVDGGEAISG